MSFSPLIRHKLLDQTKHFPSGPGVYIMKNSAGGPIYIGKAVDLRSRVRSYFSDAHETRAQIPFMLDRLASIGFIATATEAEALILEADLIRLLKPHYNIDQRDDKHFPYLKVTVQEPFPRLLIARRVENDGARYFGPYTDALAMRRIEALAKKAFRLCDCSRPLPSAREIRPCINCAMGRCSGACAGRITPQAYREQIGLLLRFLSGRRTGLLALLDHRMKKASAELRYEEAASIRDQIRLIREESRSNHVLKKMRPDESGCEELRKVLGLPRPPLVIEAFDISNIGGSFCVAGMVRFTKGVPEKSGYRRFTIKTVPGQNDFAMIMEAVSRRLTRLQNERKAFPDLLLIDGGKGQLHAAVDALARFENPPPVAAIAKKEEILYSPGRGQGVRLPAAHPARRLAERVRDEAHRFAISFHRSLRGKQFSRSGLEDLPGIGPKKAKLLLKAFGSIKRINDAAPEEIAKVRGFNSKSALRLKKSIQSSSPAPRPLTEFSNRE
jgi:excinuclease ABC subunit C